MGVEIKFRNFFAFSEFQSVLRWLTLSGWAFGGVHKFVVPGKILTKVLGEPAWVGPCLGKSAVYFTALNPPIESGALFDPTWIFLIGMYSKCLP